MKIFDEVEGAQDKVVAIGDVVVLSDIFLAFLEYKASSIRPRPSLCQAVTLREQYCPRKEPPSENGKYQKQDSIRPNDGCQPESDRYDIHKSNSNASKHTITNRMSASESPLSAPEKIRIDMKMMRSVRAKLVGGVEAANTESRMPASIPTRIDSSH